MGNEYGVRVGGRSSAFYLFAARKKDLCYSVPKKLKFFPMCLLFYWLVVLFLQRTLLSPPTPPPNPMALQFLEDHINLPPFCSISPRFYSSKEISLEKLPSTFLCTRSFMFLGEATIGERLYRPTLILGILLGTTSLRNKVAE